MTPGRALVLGDDTRSFLATVRSLGRQGIEVHVAPGNFRSPALRSRYIAAIHDIPPWMDAGADWLAAMEALLTAHRFDLVIPCDETTLLPIQHHRAQLERLTRLAIPDDGAIAVLFDKHETRELAQRLGIPVSPGRLLRRDDVAASVLAEFGTPVVVKPRQSYRLDRLYSRGKAQVVRDTSSLDRALRDSRPEEAVLEQLFPGQGLGLSLLASRGRVLQCFEHHRVREVSGASFYRISAAPTQALVQACSAIVAALDYTGIGMFEFRRNESGRFVLLEVNARPWGSMPLPLALGVDFPFRWYRLLTVGEELPETPYRTGVYGRNLVPDLLLALDEARRPRLGPLQKAGFVAGRGVELLRGLGGGEVHDVLVRDDPRPGLAELSALAAKIGQRAARQVPAQALRQRRQARAAAVRALQDRPAPEVIFVCQGNICRSPFAAALLRRRLGEASGVTVASAGMIPRPGRTTPEAGLRAAAEFGIDLSDHRSAWLARTLADRAALILVFDDWNRAAVLDRYPDLAARVLRLDALGDAGGEIADPIGSAEQVFAACYRRIEACLAAVQDLLQRPAPALQSN